MSVNQQVGLQSTYPIHVSLPTLIGTITVWVVRLGIVGFVRPCLPLAIPCVILLISITVYAPIGSSHLPFLYMPILLLKEGYNFRTRFH